MSWTNTAFLSLLISCVFQCRTFHVPAVMNAFSLTAGSFLHMAVYSFSFYNSCFSRNIIHELKREKDSAIERKTSFPSLNCKKGTRIWERQRWIESNRRPSQVRPAVGFLVTAGIS